MSYELTLQNFSGPLAKLLELIEERKLEITTISLAEVTADFLRYVQGLTDVHPRVLADFVLVAGRLILVKSKSLLPSLEFTEEEEESIKDLEERLKLYREFKNAQNYLRNFITQGEHSLSRSLFLNLPPIFSLTQPLSGDDMLRALAATLSDLERTTHESQSLKFTLVSVEEKIKEITERITRELRSNFSSLSEDKSREEIIALFLAILTLFKDNIIKIEQEDSDADIHIIKNTSL